MRFTAAHRFGHPSRATTDSATPTDGATPTDRPKARPVGRAVEEAGRRLRTTGRPHRRPTAQQRTDAQNVLRGSIWDGVSLVSEPGTRQYTAREILNFCLDLGELMQGAGADTRSVEATVVAICGTWDLLPVEIDLATSSIYLMYTPPEGPPIVTLRVVREDISDLGRLDRLQRVVENIVLQGADLPTATENLDRVATDPPRWSPPAMTLANAVLGVSVCLQCGGTPRAAIGAFGLAFALTALGFICARQALPAFFTAGAQTIIGGGVATIAISTGVLTPGGAAAALAACVVLLLPHASIVAFARDAITGFRANAAIRSISIGLTIMGLLFGLQLGLSLASGLSVEVDPTDITLKPLPIALAVVSSMFAAGANCVAQGSGARVIPVAAVASACSLVVLRTGLHLGLSNTEATFVAATVLGAVCTWWAARQHTSSTVYAVPAFCGALLPALPVADSLLSLVARESNSGWRLILAILSTLAIGAGLVLGALLATRGARRVVRARVRSLDPRGYIATGSTSSDMEHR